MSANTSLNKVRESDNPRYLFYSEKYLPLRSIHNRMHRVVRGGAEGSASLFLQFSLYIRSVMKNRERIVEDNKRCNVLI